MAFTEITSTGWLGRIGNSIKGVLFGLVLVPIAGGVLVLNERNAVRDLRANAELASKVVSVANHAVDPANEGRLVHVNGPAQTGEVLQNEAFGIEARTIRVSWDASIYQWQETSKQKTRKKAGGGEETVTTYHYQQIWSPTTIDSSGFKEAGHENRGERTLASGLREAQNVTLGAFALPSGLVAQIVSSERLPLNQVPPAMAQRGRLSGGVFYTGDPTTPRIGDEKLEFSITKPGNVSVIAVQSGKSFTPFVTENGKTKFLLYEGLLSAAEVVQGEEQKAMLFRWVLRGVGVLVMFFGLSLLLKPLSVLADVVPFFGSLVGFVTGGVAFLASLAISLVIIALSWLAFRPVIAIPLLALAAAAVVCLIVLMARARSRTRMAV